MAFRDWLPWAKKEEVEVVEPTVEDMKDSNEPWIDIKGKPVGDQIHLEADWNDAFIEHLRNNGYTGASDEAIVQRYIAEMHKQLMTDQTEGDSEYV